MLKVEIDQIFSLHTECNEEASSCKSGLSGEKPVVDVRSPCEFIHAHIPGAINLPLFSDEERKLVGIEYKQCGSRAAIEKGLRLVQFHQILEQIHGLKLPASFYVYCARGGMRSTSMGWLLELLGYQVSLIQGGYKSFRRWTLDQFTRDYSLMILAGETGVGKTRIIKDLQKSGQAAIDLEGLAQHRGSVFGHDSAQPSQEQFENELAISLFDNRNHPIWIEDESQRIGDAVIPNQFFDQMRKASTIVLEAPQEQRIQTCINEYMHLGDEQLTMAVLRLKKRLGGSETKRALDALEKKNYRECCEILLHYYDKKYRFGISKRDPKTLQYLAVDEFILAHKSLVSLPLPHLHPVS